MLSNANSSLLEKSRREHQRWLCLSWLESNRPAPMSDGALLALLHSQYADAKPPELLRALDYLDLGGWLTVDKKKKTWLVRLTRQGVDFVDYVVPETPGIRRPPLER